MGLRGDRRVCERSDIVGELWGSLRTVQELSFRNIGRGGALLEAKRPLPLSSVHRLRFALGAVEGGVEARVCHVENVAGPDGSERCLIGVEFVLLPPPIVALIERLVEIGPESLATDDPEDS